MNTKCAKPFMEVNKKHRSRTVPGTPTRATGGGHSGGGKGHRPTARAGSGKQGGKLNYSSMRHRPPPTTLPFGSRQEPCLEGGEGENPAALLL